MGTMQTSSLYPRNFFTFSFLFFYFTIQVWLLCEELECHLIQEKTQSHVGTQKNRSLNFIHITKSGCSRSTSHTNKCDDTTILITLKEGVLLKAWPKARTFFGDATLLRRYLTSLMYEVDLLLISLLLITYSWAIGIKCSLTNQR